MSKTLAQLVTAVGANVADLYEGVAASGSATTLADNSLVVAGDDEYNGAELCIRSAGSIVYVTDFDAATKTLTFSPALSSTIAGADPYEMRRRHLYADAVRLVNQAIRDMQGEALIDADETTVLAASTYEYATTLAAIYRVELLDAGDNIYDRLQPGLWRIQDGKLYISYRVVDEHYAKTVRVSGYTHPSELAARTDVTALWPPFIEAYATWKLAVQMGNTKLAEHWYMEKERQRAKAITQLRANTRWVIR